MYVHIFIPTHTHKDLQRKTLISPHTRVYIYVCIYIYKHIYIHIYKYEHVYISAHTYL